MAEDHEAENHEEDTRPKESKKEQADLERVTDYAEEKEITNINVNNLQTINQIEAERTKQNQAREQELAKVCIKKEDVLFIANEMQMTHQQSELALRRNNGDLAKALVSLMC